MSVSAWSYNHLCTLLGWRKCPHRQHYEPAALCITFAYWLLQGYSLCLGWIYKAGCQEQEQARREVVGIYRISSSLQIPPITSPFVLLVNLLNCKLFVESCVPLMFQQATFSMGRLGRISVGKLLRRALTAACFSHTELSTLRQVKKGFPPFLSPPK